MTNANSKNDAGMRDIAPTMGSSSVRPNVVPVSNVFRRIEGLPAYQDTSFRIHVRGADAIKELLQAVVGLIDWSRSIGTQSLPELNEDQENAIRHSQGASTDGVPFGLTRGQVAQARGLRCHCGRVDFGQKRAADGQLRWGYLWQFGAKCLCQRSSDVQSKE